MAKLNYLKILHSGVEVGNDWKRKLEASKTSTVDSKISDPENNGYIESWNKISDLLENHGTKYVTFSLFDLLKNN